MGKLKLMTIIGTRPEIIRLSATIKCCDRYFEQILVHTGQNYDYTLNQVFFDDLGLRALDYYLNAVGDDLGATIGNIIEKSYKLMVQVRPDAVLVLGDTNSCLSVIGAKRLHIPIFHMEAGNRCKDECLPEETNRRIVDIISDINLCYSEHARRYLMECGLPKERTFVTGSPMAEVLHANLDKIEGSDIHRRLGLTKGQYILLSAHREENIDTDRNFVQLFTAVNAMAEKYDMPILYSCHPRSRKRLEATGFHLDSRVIAHEPLGFHDYNCLQMNAFCVVSDSGTLPEESSFFTSVGHPFPAVLRIFSVSAVWSMQVHRAAGRGRGCGDEPERRPRPARAQLRGRECLRQGRQDHPELHRCCQQDGVAQILSDRNTIYYAHTGSDPAFLAGKFPHQRYCRGLCAGRPCRGCTVRPAQLSARGMV